MTISVDRWRMVDDVIQRALACERDRRDAFVREACGTDDALRSEVTSLLASHDGAPANFLELPAAESLGLMPLALAELQQRSRQEPNETIPQPVDSVRPRLIRAHSAVFASLVTIVVGGLVGAGFARSSVVQRWTANWPAPVLAPNAAFHNDADGADPDGLTLAVVDRTGAPLRTIAVRRPWTPRFSPDGHQVAYGAFGSGRSTSDVWVTDLSTGDTRRLTDNDDDSNDPRWSPDGNTLAYSVAASDGKDIVEQPAKGGVSHVVAARPGNQFLSDWLRDGSALLVMDDAGRGAHDIVVQPVDGSTPWSYVATSADETAARISSDGRWVAYTSDESGKAQVYVDSYPHPGRRLTISSDGGQHPVWRGDGRELYYWHNDELVAVSFRVVGDASPTTAEQTVLFRAPYESSINSMYDVSPDGRLFVIVERRSR